MTTLTCEPSDQSTFDEQVQEAQRRVEGPGGGRFLGESGREPCTLTGREILAKLLTQCAFTKDYEAHLSDLKSLLSAADNGTCLQYRYGGRCSSSVVLAYVANHCVRSGAHSDFEGVAREYDSGLGKGITRVPLPSRPPPPPPHRFLGVGPGLLLVRHVQPATTEEELKAHFEGGVDFSDGTGGVEGCDFLLNSYGSPSMYAVVKLEHWSRADAFVLALDGSDFGGLQLRVEKVSSRFTGAGFSY